jgi:hypothetical protein
MKYSKRTVDEAVQLLDCYAAESQKRHGDASMFDVANRAKASADGLALACEAWSSALSGDDSASGALEAAQRLREGWRP